MPVSTRRNSPLGEGGDSSAPAGGLGGGGGRGASRGGARWLGTSRTGERVGGQRGRDQTSDLERVEQ